MAAEKMVRMTLRRSVGRGGKYYGPGEVDVPESLANALGYRHPASAGAGSSETTVAEDQGQAPAAKRAKKKLGRTRA